MRPKEEKKFLKQVNKVIGDVLTEEERKTLLEAIRKHCQNNPNTNTNKFGVEVVDMVTGEYKKAVDGLNALLGLSDDEHILPNQSEKAIEAMEREIIALDIKEAKDLIYYVLHQKSKEKQYVNGTCDQGRVGRTLDDFVEDPIAKQAKLNKADVAALRIYTSAVFKYINGPLRNSEVEGLRTWSPGQPHPLPITVLLISRALKKLKRVAGPEDGIAEMVLWRGMKNLRPADEFITEGGKCIMSL